MLGYEELKKNIDITDTTVECPVRGCGQKVERQRKVFKLEKRFKCPEHNIHISPSTFQYAKESDNLLWEHTADSDLLENVYRAKRESRMARDNSEDAVTWNVFRFLEKNGLIESALSPLVGVSLRSPELIYWSYSQAQNSDWKKLVCARNEFGEKPNRGSEPDLIIKTDRALIFVEAKLTAGNKTTPSKNSDAEAYQAGGGSWFDKVFKSGFPTIAEDKKKYELLRFWLLGTWMAKQNLQFRLVNLVRSGQEENIEGVFGKHIRENQTRKFIRITWEDIYKQILNIGLPGTDKETMMQYFRNKTIGYGNGKLRKAFSI